MTVTSSAAVIRQWARDNGLPVGDRGRLSPQLLIAYAGSTAVPEAPNSDISRAPRRLPRLAPSAVHIPVQPTPGATGIARKIAARTGYPRVAANAATDWTGATGKLLLP